MKFKESTNQVNKQTAPDHWKLKQISVITRKQLMIHIILKTFVCINSD